MKWDEIWAVVLLGSLTLLALAVLITMPNGR